MSSKSIGATFPTAHFVSQSHFGNSHSIAKFFIITVICYSDLPFITFYPLLTHSNLDFIHCCNCLCKITNDFYYPESLGHFLAFSDFPEHSPAVSCLLDFCETPLSRFSHFSCFAHSSISPVHSFSSTYTLKTGRYSGTVLVTNSLCTVFFPWAISSLRMASFIICGWQAQIQSPLWLLLLFYRLNSNWLSHTSTHISHRNLKLAISKTYFTIFSPF